MKRFVFSIICSLSVLAAYSAQGQEVTISPPSGTLTINEGGSATINITQTADSSTTYRYQVYTARENTGDPAPDDWSYQPWNWYVHSTTTQGSLTNSVTIQTVHDDDGQDDTGYDATLVLWRHLPDNTGWTKIADYQFTIKDDDTRGIVLPSKYLESVDTPNGTLNNIFAIDEGSDKTFTLALATEPVGGNVTVTVKSGWKYLYVYPSTLTFSFNGGNWRVPQTVTLRSPEDDDAYAGDTHITISASGADYDGVRISPSPRVWLRDNDKLGFDVSSSTLSIKEGNKANFTLKLAAKQWTYGAAHGYPTFVDLASSHNQVSVSPSRLTFYAPYWNIPQTVTVSVADDEDAVIPQAAITLTGAGQSYYGMTDSVKINVVESETLGVEVYNSSGVRPFGLTTLEGADVDYKMRLTSKPSGGNATLSLSVSSGSDVSFSPSSLTFTPSNWKTLQTVTATTAEDDDEIRNDSTLTIAASGADYGDYSRTMDVYAQDNDIPTYIRLPTGSVTVKEGEIVDFTIRLTAKPAENMTVVHNIPQGNSSLYRIEDKSDGVTTFHFTPDNWNVPQTVSYFALWKSKGTNDDNVRRLTTRMLTGISGRTETYVYDQVILAGNGSPMVLSSDALDIGEGSSGTFTLRLREKPVEDSNQIDENLRIVVALRKSGSGDVTISPTSLTFTPSDWDTAQTVTVSTVADADNADDSARISFSASGRTFGTANLTDGVRISVKEKALVLSPSTLDIDEGGNERFSVELGAKPSGNVNVSLTSSDSQLSVSPASLIFTPSNWNSAQNVTANAAEDDDRVASTARIDLSASGADYAGITARVAVSIGDDDTVRFSPVYEIDAGGRRKAIDALKMPEFSYRILGMYLEAKPSGNVTVSLTTSGHAGLTVDPTSLTFTPSNYYTLQKFKVRSPIFHGATEKSLTLSASGGGYDDIVRKLSVTVDDSNGLGISEGQLTPLEIVEGESETFTVVLRDTLSGNERAHVDLAKSEGTDSSVITDKILSISPRVLRFDSTNHSRPQTVTIAALADDDRDDENGSFSLDAFYYDPPNGADLSGNGWRAYQTRSATHSVKIQVKDNTVLQPSTPAGLTLSETSTLTISEGGSKNFTVVLDKQPVGGSVTVSTGVSAGAGASAGASANTGSDLSLSPTRLTFTASDWKDPKTVTVSAAEDDDAANDNASVSLSASGADYTNVTESMQVSILDDDPRGLAFDSLDLGLTEGSQNQFTVNLVSQPSGGNVTVAITKSSGSDDVSFSPARLTFTDSNWTTPQNVTVSAAEDADGVDDRATLAVSASGADYAGISDSVSVKITDNDKPGLTIDPSSLDVPEGGSANFKVKLTGAPIGGDVSVAIVKSGSGDVTISLASLTFAAANWASEQTVTVNAAEDDDAANDTASLSLTASGANYGGITDSVDIEVSDDEERNLTLSAPSLGLTEGASKDFTVKLTAAPIGGDVTVTVNKSGSDDVTVSPASLTFKESNWNSTQNVTVNAAEDIDGVDDSASVSLTVSGADYTAIPDSSVRIDVSDNDSPGLTLAPTSLSVNEGGDERLGISLTAAPTGGNVIVAIAKSGSDDVTFSPASLTFTADNWESVQSVTVSAQEDEDGAADSASLSLSASGADYDDVSEVVQVAVKDNDEKGLSVDSTLSLNEGGDKDLTFSLKTKPVGGDVTVAVTKSGSTDVSVSPSSLTFTAENWNNPQTLNVSAAEDSDGVDDSARISLSASGADYGGLTADISVEVSDKDTPGLTLAPTTLRVDEGDDTTLEVSLSAQPSGGNVTVAIAKSGSDDVTISPTSLTFTPSNWRSTRSVTVSAAEDDDGADDSANLRLTASGADYAGIVDNVRVEVDDDDPKGLTLAPESLSVTEGNAKNFTVALKTQPASGSVVVSLNASGSSEVSVSPARMTFTASNWNAPKTATVNADEDDDGVKDTATVSLAASGADYGAIADELQVEVNDNDAPGLTFDPSTLDVAEGGEASLEVGLTVQPTGGDVTLALTKSGSEDVSLSPASLTFTPSNWTTPRIVTVVAAEDDDGVKDTAALSVAASGADYDGITGNVQVRVSENETVGLVVEPAILGLTEGGEGAFTAKLSAQPTGGNVALFVTKSGSPDVLLTSTNLIFTADDWSVEQSVTVRANEDHDGIADSAVVSLSASGADYGGVSGGVQVQVSDNDAPGLVLSSLLLAVDEGGSGSVGVKLSVEPSGDVSLALTKNGSADVSFTPSSMTFTPSNWDESQAITVNAAEDSDGHPDTASLSLTATGADYEGITAGVQVQVVENEAFGLSATPRELEVREGEEAPFTVSLTAQPNWNVSVALTSENPDVSLSPSTLRFTPSDWNRPKTVVARAAEDDDLLADSTTVTLRASGADFDDITGSMQITVIDDDAEEGINPQVVFDLTLTPESLSLDEGSSARFTVRARAQPVDEEMVVTLVGGGSPDVSFDTDPDTDGLQSALTLTPDNWDVEQPVSVRAAEDDDAAPDRASASFVDAGGKVIIVGRVSVAVADDDTPGLSVDPATLRVAENTSGSFTVRPVTRPLGDILVSFDNGETDTALSPPNLKFTSSNWRRARSVTVDGVADVDAEDDAPADITLTARGGGYDGVSARVQVGVDEAAPGTLPEEAVPGLVIVGAPVEIDEGGTRDLRVRLRNRPTGDVELALSVSGASIEVDTDTWREGNQSALRFSPSNYNGTRVVSLFAPEDEDTNDGRASVSLVASGANYDGLTAEVSVNIDDNDSPALLVSNPAVIDDRRASFTVRLSVEPSAAVEVALSVAGEVEGVAIDADPDTPGNQTALAFAASDFDVPQRVVVVADEDFEGSSVDIVLAAGGGDYAGIVDRVTVPLGVGEYTDEGDPRYWWPVRTLALAIAPPSVGDRAVVSVGCREESACEVYLDCSAQKNGASFRGGLPEAIVGWGVARLSAQDIVDITGGDWSGMGRLGCALHSEERISAQVWTRSGDGVLVNNSALVRSVNIEGVHRADIESIPGPGEMDLSNIRIRCRAAYTKHCSMTALSCYDDEGSGYRGDLGTIERGRVRHVQTSELADLIGHRWSGATLGCEFRSDEPFTVQVLTRTGGGGALVNNNATGQMPF